MLEHEIAGATQPLVLNLTAPKSAGADQNPTVAEVETLRTENAALSRKLAEASSVNAESASDRERELKGLVQQFTHDSREMLSCIQKLESENTELRQQLRQLSKDAA